MAGVLPLGDIHCPTDRSRTATATGPVADRRGSGGDMRLAAFRSGNRRTVNKHLNSNRQCCCGSDKFFLWDQDRAAARPVEV